LLLTLTATPAGSQPPSRIDSGSVRQEETARERYQRVPDIFDAMKVRPGAVVADVGAGSGFLTVRLARAVGAEGRVYAVDVDAQVLERLRSRVQDENLGNVEIVRGALDDPHLPSASLDAAVIVNAYHEMRAYHPMLDHLRSALKPGGRLVLVEPLSEKRRHDSRDALARVHEIAAAFAEDDVRTAGFTVARLEDPFTTRGADFMWLLVAVPDPHGASAATTPADDARPAAASQNDESSSLDDPDLRMSMERFKQLRERGAVVVVDVRGQREFEDAHIPDAISIPLDQIQLEVERLRSLRKPIVTCCS
jgi:precorrin-6B methylase 2